MSSLHRFLHSKVRSRLQGHPVAPLSADSVAINQTQLVGTLLGVVQDLEMGVSGTRDGEEIAVVLCCAGMLCEMQSPLRMPLQLGSVLKDVHNCWWGPAFRTAPSDRFRSRQTAVGTLQPLSVTNLRWMTLQPSSWV